MTRRTNTTRQERAKPSAHRSPDQPFWDEVQAITAFPAGHNAEWRVELVRREGGEARINIRKWWTTDEAPDIWKPTREGITIIASPVAEYMQTALTQAIETLATQGGHVMPLVPPVGDDMAKILQRMPRENPRYTRENMRDHDMGQ